VSLPKDEIQKKVPKFQNLDRTRNLFKESGQSAKAANEQLSRANERLKKERLTN
jgi:FtsZ-binding cell division protein ZapB